MECCDKECVVLEKVKELEEEFSKFKEQNRISHESIYGRLNNLEKDSAVQAVVYKNILEKLDALTLSMDKISADVAELKAKPGKRWEGIVEKFFYAIVAGVAGMMLAKYGM